MKWIKASDRLPEAQQTIICKVDGHGSFPEGHKAVLNGYWSEMFKLFYIYDRTDVYPYDAEHITWLDESADPAEALTAADYEEVLVDHKRLVRELDVIMNGEHAAKQASLVDLVAQARGWKHSAEVLVKALRKCRKEMIDGSWFAKTIDTALEQYKKETT
ncbi:MAG TPA: hypothetical protein VHL77_06785 [Ferruginibacter sp.]|jgi:hypothetical protein|nr:hypothetical protein [Ferruginibacter sp.]